MCCNLFSGSKQFSIWILGHSFIFRARRRAQARNYGLNLGFSSKEAKIVWFGLRGARWNDLHTIIAKLHCQWGKPDIIFIHLGGNDIGRIKTIDLIKCMRRDLAQLHFALPDTIIVWSEIISRQPWLTDIRLKPLERCRRKINHNLSKFLESLKMLPYRHSELELGGNGLQDVDGVHLSDIGHDIFNVGIQNAIEKAIFKWKCANTTSYK